MGFRTLLPLFGRLALLVAAGAGAGVAWRSGYMASLALCLGLLLAGASLLLGHARVRRTAAVAVLVGLAAWTIFSPLIVS